MVKTVKTAPNKPAKKFHLPMRLILFWHKKLKTYIYSQKNKDKNFQFPTIYISPKYPKMNILELYQRIQNHLMKHFPNIYNKLNSNNKKHKDKIESDSQKQKDVKLNNSENENNKNINNNSIKLVDEKYDEMSKNQELKLKNSNIDFTLSEEIKLINESNCCQIENLFKSHKFENDVSEKYDNYFVKVILLKNTKNELSSNKNKLENSPSKSASTISSNESNKSNNKINFVTYCKNISMKPKYYNNDSYYFGKLKLIGKPTANQV